ncbi:MAG: hypothetical protein NXI10_17710 [bacterium]|nr:hypothetical protein [bacterium]
MNDAFLSQLIPVFILFVILFIVLVYIYSYLKRRNKKHALNYDQDMRRFLDAVENKDIKSIQFYGDKMVWNVHLKQSDKRIIYEAIKPIEVEHPELKQLWKDVHYKIHGHEPLNIRNEDDPWILKGNFTNSEEDIIDR